MVSSTELAQIQGDFLYQVSQQFNFSRKKKEIFICRFHPENESLGNQELANKVYADDEIVDIAQSFQYHLNEICKEFEKKEFQLQNYPHKGRPRKGESPWKQAFTWLWDVQFQEWRSQQTNHKIYGNLDETFDPQFYVRRVCDESKCYEALLEPGALIRIKGSQQIGKSWLMGKLLEKLATEGYRTINLSFKLVDRKVHFNDLDRFLRWFCNNVSLQLGLSNYVDESWDEVGFGSKVNCTIFVEELLKQEDTPVVLCLDDVDWIFPYPDIYEDFFALIRSWHEKAKSRKALWTKLRIVIIHSTEAYIRLNINQSPFNIGIPFDLPEFNQQEVQQLVCQYGFQWSISQIEQLMGMMGGYPPLVQQTLTHLKTHPDVTLEQILETATLESGIYSNHLRSHLWNLKQHPELALAFKQVVSATEAVQLVPMQTHQLLSLGLVILSGNDVKPRCKLYRQYFSDRLGDI